MEILIRDISGNDIGGKPHTRRYVRGDIAAPDESKNGSKYPFAGDESVSFVLTRVSKNTSD